MNVNADEQHHTHTHTLILITMKLENFQDNLERGIWYIALSSDLQCIPAHLARAHGLYDEQFVKFD